MAKIKQAKIDVVVKQFEAQLIKDQKLEENRINDVLQGQFESKLQELET